MVALLPDDHGEYAFQPATAEIAEQVEMHSECENDHVGEWGEGTTECGCLVAHSGSCWEPYDTNDEESDLHTETLAAASGEDLGCGCEDSVAAAATNQSHYQSCDERFAAKYCTFRSSNWVVTEPYSADGIGAEYWQRENFLPIGEELHGDGSNEGSDYDEGSEVDTLVGDGEKAGWKEIEYGMKEEMPVEKPVKTYTVLSFPCCTVI